MNKKFLIVCILLGILLMFSNMGVAQELNIKWGHAQPPSHPSNVAMNEIANELKEKTDGKINIEIYPSSQLGSAKDMIEGLIIGTQDMAYDGAGVMSAFLPKISIFEAPFLYKDYDHLQRVVSSAIAQTIFDELLERRGIRILDVWYYGIRHITTKGKKVNSLEDLKGLKLRVPEIPLYLDTIRSLGVNPTPMPFAELYLALQTGTVDGQENPLAVIDSGKLYEVQDSVLLSGHITGLQFVMISENTWNKLSEEQQKILINAIEKAGDSQDKVILNMEDQLLDNFVKMGLNVTEIDRQILREAANEVYKKYSDIWGIELTKQFMEIE